MKLKKAFSFCLLAALIVVASAREPGQNNIASASATESTDGGFTYGNEWFDASRTYVKLQVPEDGVYRLTSADLSAANFPVNGNLSNLQLHYRGKEQYMHVESSGGTLNFVEFYGRRNDGKEDSILYRHPYNAIHDPSQQPNDRLSLFSDTSAYWLSYGNNPGIRYQPFNDQNYSNYLPEPFFTYESYHEYHPATGGNNVMWNYGGGSQYDIFHILNSYYITGEGYVGRGFGNSNDHTVSIPTPYAVNVGNPVKFKVQIYGRSSWLHDFAADVDGNPSYRDTVSGVYVRTRNFNYYGNLANTTQLTLHAYGTQNNNTDNNNYCWSTTRYDHLFDMGGNGTIKMVEWFKNQNSYFRFSNSDVGSAAVAYDLKEKIRCVGTGSGDTTHIVVPASTNGRDIFIATDNGIRTPTIVPHRLTNLTDPANDADFVIITHRSLSSSANAYAYYRDTCTVNPHKARVVYVDEIYDEFGYGAITPLAIKRFCKYTLDNWTTTPAYFLLWGKGQVIIRGQSAENLVPTYSYPACDYGFVSDFDPYVSNPVPLAAVGRVNVYDNTDGQTYLQKVLEYEHTPWSPWMKQAVFLGGGSDTTEQKPILSFLRDYYMPYVEGAPLGGNGHYYQKYNTGEITNSPFTSTQRINSGVGVIHFFGHSSNNIYDVDIQEPVLYQNYGKYPMMIAFGCYGGNFTGSGKSFGERFVLEKDRGSINYIANSTAGYLTPLGNFGRTLYPVLYGSHVGQPIGDVLKESIRQFFATWTDQVYVNHAKQMNLQGDPAIALYYPRKPDLAIAQPDIYFEPADFSAADSGFTINVVTHNDGLVTNDSFYLSIRQKTPTGTNWIVYPTTQHAPVVSKDTLSYFIYNNIGAEMAGLNEFDVFVDSTNLIDEYSENNNRVIFQQLIPGNVPAILYPYDYAVVGEQNIKLSASTFVMSNQAQVKYIYEIDTVITFNSPFYQRSGVVSGTATYSEWELPFTLTDSTVYYWRVRLAQFNPPTWASASFKYIANRRGWAQSRPPQFFKDVTQRISMDQTNYDWNFDKWSAELHAFLNQGQHGNYRMANGAFANILPPNNSLKGVLYTPIRARDLHPLITGTSMGDWRFIAMPDGQGDLVGAIADMKDGDYFLCVSERDPKISSWAPQVFEAFHMIGVDTSKLSAIPSGNSFIVLGRKDRPGEGIIIDKPNVIDVTANIEKLDLRKALHTNHSRGNIFSTTIGPASDWDELIWNWKTTDLFVDDDVRVSLYAVRNDDTDSLVLSNLGRGTYNLSMVDPDRFPFMRLVADAKDSLYLTAPQLKHWHVLHTPAPDAVIDPITAWDFKRDTVREGDNITSTFSVRNVSEWDMDSLLIRFVVQRADRSTLELGRQRFASIQAGGLNTYSYTFSTGNNNMRGDLTFLIELNPDNDQVELHHFNNFYAHPFHVLPDDVNPIMDVTFDGKHLMNGDIVSPMPEILIEINDDNEYLAVNDTAFEVYFGPKTPNPNSLPRIFIGSNSQMEVIPATLPDNKAQLYFRPSRLEDGEYMLRVQGYDQTGNAAGKTEYEITFKVVNENAVSNVLNYPNPFSTRTRWVYTLTGSELPETFEIHIYTISGRLVKIIDLNETNDVRFGYNMTEYAWDGRDEFGDLLANGVYIYKVVARLNGKELKTRDEGITDLFRNGYGKLYIMR